MKDFATRDDHLQTIDNSRGQNQFGGDHGLLRVSEWCYHGIWSVLTRWLKVPRDPPDLPTKSGENLWVGRRVWLT